MLAEDSLNPAPRHSLRQVAEAAGVSTMTVSRAFRKNASVRPAVRARILELAQKMGYAPDPRITSVMGALVRRSQPSYRETLAYIGYQVSTDNAHMERFHKGAVRRAVDLGYRLDSFWLKEKTMSFSRLDRMLRARNIRGLIIGPPLYQAHGHVRLGWNRYVAVTMGSSLWKPRLNRVQHHHYMGMILALRIVRQHRGKRIGLVISSLLNSRGQGSLISSFLTNQAGPSAELSRRVHLYTDWDKNRFTAWLKQTRLDVIICGQLDEVRRIEPYTAEYGFRIVCMDVISEGTAVAGIDQHYEVIGSHAVDLVLSELQHRKFGLPEHPKTLMIEGSWCEGPGFPASSRHAT